MYIALIDTCVVEETRAAAHGMRLALEVHPTGLFELLDQSVEILDG